jgi:hypothetical protein
MDEIEIFLRLAFAGLGLILTVLTFASWARNREPKVLLAGLGFGTLAAEGLMLSAGAFSAKIEEMNTTLALVGLSFVAMVFLYTSILKR